MKPLLASCVPVNGTVMHQSYHLYTCLIINIYEVKEAAQKKMSWASLQLFPQQTTSKARQQPCPSLPQSDILRFEAELNQPGHLWEGSQPFPTGGMSEKPILINLRGDSLVDKLQFFRKSVTGADIDIRTQSTSIVKNSVYYFYYYRTH